METGIISQPADAYHKANGVSRSMLEWISPPRTAAHFHAKFIDKLIPDEDTPALRIGSITHRAILESETMDNAVHIKPDTMNFATKDGKAWRDEHNDRPVISTDDFNRINGMRTSVWAHPMASRLLKGSDFERSAFADDKGFLLKSRYDVLPKSGNAIADIKTCESADLESVEKSMFNYGYFRQAAFYLRVAELLNLDRSAFVFIFVEKSPPYAVACYQLVDEVLNAGRMMIERDLQVLRNCYDTNKWPGYSNSVEACGLPVFAMKQIEAIV